MSLLLGFFLGGLGGGVCCVKISNHKENIKVLNPSKYLRLIVDYFKPFIIANTCSALNLIDLIDNDFSFSPLNAVQPEHKSHMHMTYNMRSPFGMRLQMVMIK